MNLHNQTQVFVGDGLALTAGDQPLNAITTQLGIVGGDMTTVAPAGETIGAHPEIYIVNKLANGNFKRSNPIRGTSVVGYKGSSYKPAARKVASIGHNRLLNTGTINVANSTLYSFSIVFKSDKTNHGVRPERLSLSFTSSAAASQSNIADQIVSAINGSAYGNSVSGIKQIKAIKVADGTGIFGLTGATDFGVEITALDINQFASTTFTPELVNFDVFVDDASGFGSSTTAGTIQNVFAGIGTYEQVSTLEKRCQRSEGFVNKTAWPTIESPALLASATGVSSGTLAVATATVTAGGDTVVFSANPQTHLFAGSQITIGGTAYEIKYFIDTLNAVLTTTSTAGHTGGSAVTAKVFYDLITLEVIDTTALSGSGADSLSGKSIVIATPAIVSGATATNVASAEGANLMTLLNTWTASTPLAPTSVVI